MFPPSVNHEGRRRVDNPQGVSYTRWLPPPPWKVNGLTLEERIECIQQEREAFKLHQQYHHNPSLCSTTEGTTPEGRSCLIGSSTGVETVATAMHHSTQLQADEGSHRHQSSDINNHKSYEVKASPPPLPPSRSSTSIELRSPKSINPTSVYQSVEEKHHHHQPAAVAAAVAGHVYHRVINNTSSIDVKHSNMCPVIVPNPTQPQQAITYPSVGSTFYGGIGVLPQQQQYCYFA